MYCQNFKLSIVSNRVPLYLYACTPSTCTTVVRTDGTSVKDSALATLIVSNACSIWSTPHEIQTSLHDLITDSHPSDAREDWRGRARYQFHFGAVSSAMYDPANVIMLTILCSRQYSYFICVKIPELQYHGDQGPNKTVF